MLGKRKKGLRDMLPGLENELRNLTNAEGLATSEGMEYLVERLGSRCDEGALSRDAAWYTLHTALGHVAPSFTNRHWPRVTPSPHPPPSAPRGRYNDDDQLQAALGELLATSRAMAPGGLARADDLAALPAETVGRFGFRSDAFTSAIVAAVKELYADSLPSSLPVAHA